MSNSIDKYAKTVAEINLAHLDYNLKQIRSKVGAARIIAVVKADAYGHNVADVVYRLRQAEVDFFAVARIKEAIELRQLDVKEPILVFGRLMADEIQPAIENKLRMTITNLSDINRVESIAEKLNIKAIVHLNIDTGMGRVGILPSEIELMIKQAKSTNNIIYEGIYSHFSTSDTADKTFAKKQLQHFKYLINQCRENDLNFPLIHIANSGAILDIPMSYQPPFNAIRPGILLYGAYPSVETSESIKLKPTMTLKTSVSEIRSLTANQPISYGLKYYTRENTQIAVLPVGYADGISRIFTNKGQVSINGRLYPIVGTVTMDQIMVKVDNNVKQGDEVLFWGESSKNKQKASDIAEQVGTISYELFTAVTSRVLKKIKK